MRKCVTILFSPNSHFFFNTTTTTMNENNISVSPKLSNQWQNKKKKNQWLGPPVSVKSFLGATNELGAKNRKETGLRSEQRDRKFVWDKKTTQMTELTCPCWLQQSVSSHAVTIVFSPNRAVSVVVTITDLKTWRYKNCYLSLHLLGHKRLADRTLQIWYAE